MYYIYKKKKKLNKKGYCRHAGRTEDGNRHEEHVYYGIRICNLKTRLH